MKRADSPAFLGSDYDDFLFSSIGEDRNGLMLSVASMLARLDLDPWHEAASFAGLPVGLATQNLTALIAALPDQAFKQFDQAALASRLIALLPGHRHTNPASAKPPPSPAPSRTLSRRQIVGMVLFVLSLGFLAAQFLLPSRDLPLPAAPSHTQAPSTDLPRTPPTSK